MQFCSAATLGGEKLRCPFHGGDVCSNGLASDNCIVYDTWERISQTETTDQMKLINEQFKALANQMIQLERRIFLLEQKVEQ